MNRLAHLVILAGLVTTSCSAQAWQAVAQGLATVPTAPPAPAHKLMIFGGQGHQTYLGCLNCSKFATDSVFNEFGSYGSPYSVDSIFNSYGEFGSAYSMYSACNAYASDPPVLVDETGSFYGRLTVNRYNPQVLHDETVLQWLEGSVCK